jgi:outer membrane protein assembly factor BamB
VTVRELLIFVGVSALALAALALLYAVRAVMRRAHAAQRQRWGGLVFRGIVIAALLAVSVMSLRDLPPPQLVNRPASAPADQTVAFIQYTQYGSAANIIGVSARDGATRWTRALAGAPSMLLSPAPGVIIAPVFTQGLTALRVSDGAVLWRTAAAAAALPRLIATDGGRLFALTTLSSAPSALIALDARTGAALWRAPTPTTMGQSLALAAGDGLVFVMGQVSDAGTPQSQWEVEALRATDGAVQWTRVSGGMGFVALAAAFFVVGGALMVITRAGPLTALRARDGSIAWTSALGGAPDNPPQIFAATSDGARIYAVAQPSRWGMGPNGAPIEPPVTLSALDARDGAVQWREHISLATSNWSLAVSDGVLLSGASVDETNAFSGFYPTGSLLTAYDVTSGRALWRDNTPVTGVTWDMSSQIAPWGASGAAYLMGVQRNPYITICVLFCPGVSWLYAVNVHTGAAWWRTRIGDATLAHLVY